MTYNKYIPKSKIIFSKAKTQDNILIIPVLNEGNRILSLLDKCKAHNINEICDIVIIDAGSNDGSLDNLENSIVNTLLQKDEKGKVAAQLQIAYDFALTRDYQQIITIDGNDKDDPKDIIKIINKLNEGFDFVQASRFIGGGNHQNTPKIRLFAVQYLHSPLLSIFSGFKWTDTTQGFRGYSPKFLQNEQVAIFREEFKHYELLFYLSYIAPKLGFQCCEVGTSRIYPKDEVPTKISFTGNFKILFELIKVCLGGYDVGKN